MAKLNQEANGRHSPSRIWMVAVLLVVASARTLLNASVLDQNNDVDYGSKVRQFTTQPFFLTDLVDHLPRSQTVPTPEQFLGYVPGEPGRLSASDVVYGYFRELARASSRVKVFTVGKSDEGRDILLVAISSEDTIERLAELKKCTSELADPRSLSLTEAPAVISICKPVYWVTGGVHPPESASPEMLMELAYRVTVDESPFFKNIRDNTVLLITPVVEVDGRDRMVELYNSHRLHPTSSSPGLIYWGKYVGHDNNRDGIALSLTVSNIQMQVFLDWHPQVLHDLHESVPYLYISTGRGPYNAWLDPLVISEWQELAYYEIQEMTQKGVPGVWTHEMYDGWAPSYMFFMGNTHNAIGRFYETFGNMIPETFHRELSSRYTNRQWYRPNPPLPEVEWSIRNTINLEESALLLALSFSATHRDDLLHNFYAKSQRAVSKATTEGPAAWIILDGRRPVLARKLVQLLQRQGVEVHRLEREIAVKAMPSPTGVSQVESLCVEADCSLRKIPANSYVVRMDQPYSRVADMLLDTQFYASSDTPPFDDTGWSLGPLFNVSTLRIVDGDILSAPMKRVPISEKMGGIIGQRSEAGKYKYYLINPTAEPSLATLRFMLHDLHIRCADAGFTVEGQAFNQGTFIIPVSGMSGASLSELDRTIQSQGLRYYKSGSEIVVGNHAIALPRIAILHTWVSTAGDGWMRLALEEWGIPFDYISDQHVRLIRNLRQTYDVIIYPPATTDLAEMIFGVPKRILPDGSDWGGPIQWEKTELTPSFGTPDHSPDIRGGLGFEGLLNLKEFVEQGGLFIATGASTNLPIQLGLASGVSIVETKSLKAPGGVYRVEVEDQHSPITFGYNESLAAYFDSSPVFRIALGADEFREAESDVGGRSSGRGSASDQDVPQGRRFVAAHHRVVGSLAEQELYIDPGIRRIVDEFLPGTIPPPELSPRVIIRFAGKDKLLISGMLDGAAELERTPAVVDAPLGRGHILLFAIDPMWRQETQGSLMLLFNAAIHFDHLGVQPR
jgi:hypothetical protein